MPYVIDLVSLFCVNGATQINLPCLQGDSWLRSLPAAGCCPAADPALSRPARRATQKENTPTLGYYYSEPLPHDTAVLYNF